MKPAFALNLSPDGIGLLHRTSRGWLLVGQVALDDPGMTEALGYLRKTALGLAPQGFTTKLILPASQILYTQVEAPGPDAANRRRQIARALEGRTPYAAEDLVFDWSGTGGRVNVAVVARETLEEAEAFAQEHRFNPVSFVAMPEEGSFAGEPFFGQTAKARSYIPEGERLVRDQDPVRIAGEADLARLAAVGEVAETAPAEASEAPGEAGMAPDESLGVADSAEAAEGPATNLAAEAVMPEAPADAVAPDPAVDEPAAEAPLPEAPAVETPATETPADEPSPREARRRARAERREREAAARAEAEAAAALARQASFGFDAAPAAGDPSPEGTALPQAPAPEELAPLPAEAAAEADAAVPEPALQAEASPGPDEVVELGDEVGPAPGLGHEQPEDQRGDETDAEASAGPSAADEAEEAPFLAVEDEDAEMAAAGPTLSDVPPDLPVPQPPELDADGVPTPFAAAATLSPVLPGPRRRLGAAEPGRAGPARPLTGDAASVISPRLGIAAEPRAEPSAAPAARAKSRASGLGKAVIAAGKMAKAAKNARGAGRRVEAAPGPVAPRSRTSSEAEALTVFGARRAAPTRGKPRYLGLILTATLVFLMLAVALWSSLLDGTGTAETDAVSSTAPLRTTAVETLAELPEFEDVPTVDALEAEAMTEAEIAADGGFEAMEGTGEPELGEAAGDLPVDLPVDLPDELPPEPAEIAAQDAPDAPEAQAEGVPDAAAAAAIAAAGAGLAPGQASEIAAADVATAAPEVPAEVAGGPLPDATEGLPPRPTDPAVTERSAETLPDTAAQGADAPPAPPQPPLPYGTGFAFSEDGLIVATPDGALTPEGVTVVAGAPAQVPPSRPEPEPETEAAATEPAAAAAGESGPAALVADPALEGIRPLPRPATLDVPAALEAPATAAPEAGAELPPAAPGDGAAVSAPLAADPALAGFKPRTASSVAVAAASAARSAEEARAAEQAALQAALASATASAVASSRKPQGRPPNFSQGIEAALAMAATTAPVVAAAAPAPQPAPAAPTRSAAAVAPAPEPVPEPEEIDEPEPVAAAPSIPTSASVAKQATIAGAISLREINLIGVYGASSSRRALVRLANGRMLRVKIGDRIDGGQVTAIGEGQLTYVKGGRSHVLRMIQQS